MKKENRETQIANRRVLAASRVAPSNMRSNLWKPELRAKKIQ